LNPTNVVAKDHQHFGGVVVGKEARTASPRLRRGEGIVAQQRTGHGELISGANPANDDCAITGGDRDGSRQRELWERRCRIENGQITPSTKDDVRLTDACATQAMRTRQTSKTLISRADYLRAVVFFL